MSGVYALYLPQFHEIEENNIWWGKGFTEWTNIRNATAETGKLKPLNDNYYCLLDKQAMLWQCELAKKYAVEGFCFYHYWFENGRTIMEKPVKMLLEDKEIPMNFFFCWANHIWTKAVNGKKEVLIEEFYGDEKDWEEHFQYLIPYFKDSRYKKIDGKPVFMLYNTNIPRQGEMTDYLKKRAVEEGLPGVYFIDSVFSKLKIESVSDSSDAVNIMMPSFVKWEVTQRFWVKVKKHLLLQVNKVFKTRKLIETISGDQFIKSWFDEPLMKSVRAGKIEKFAGKDVIYSAITMWDNTYRHHFRGSIITKPSKEMYKKMLSEIKRITDQNGVEIILINAWNEWAEGMVLEPDKENKYYFLEIIREVFGEKND